MKIIRAKVSERLLTKASRLFTGTLAGRIVEILQNARRAGATHVDIRNEGGFVTVRDNGHGIEDFAALLDLGGSHWPEVTGGMPKNVPARGGARGEGTVTADLDAAEDPAGVGLFCLAPREVVIRSRGFVAVIGQDGWTGRVVEVRSDPDRLPRVNPGVARGAGALLRFQDEPWSIDTVPNGRSITMRILFINNAGGGFADYLNVEDNLSAAKLFAQQIPGGRTQDYLIRVNRQPVPHDYVLQDGDRVTFTPTKVEGANVA